MSGEGAAQGSTTPKPLPPLIVTARLPDDLQASANALRIAHYPPKHNQLAAHVTLFHALPPFCETELRDCLADLARSHAPVAARLVGVMSLGRGTALRIESPAMLDLREAIADRFHGLLTGQDQHRPRLHVTIQNKVSPATAKALEVQLAATMNAREFAFRGLALNAYLGGPWRQLAQYTFRG